MYSCTVLYRKMKMMSPSFLTSKMTTNLKLLLMHLKKFLMSKNLTSYLMMMMILKMKKMRNKYKLSDSLINK